MEGGVAEGLPLTFRHERKLFKCVNSERDLFYVDNTRQVQGVLSGHTKREGIVIVEQIGRSSGSYYS